MATVLASVGQKKASSRNVYVLILKCKRWQYAFVSDIQLGITITVMQRERDRGRKELICRQRILGVCKFCIGFYITWFLQEAEKSYLQIKSGAKTSSQFWLRDILNVYESQSTNSHTPKSVKNCIKCGYTCSYFVYLIMNSDNIHLDFDLHL